MSDSSDASITQFMQQADIEGFWRLFAGRLRGELGMTAEVALNILREYQDPLLDRYMEYLLEVEEDYAGQIMRLVTVDRSRPICQALRVDGRRPHTRRKALTSMPWVRGSGQDTVQLVFKQLQRMTSDQEVRDLYEINGLVVDIAPLLALLQQDSGFFGSRPIFVNWYDTWTRQWCYLLCHHGFIDVDCHKPDTVWEPGYWIAGVQP